MCQARVYLQKDGQNELIAEEVIFLEERDDGVQLSTFFSGPQFVSARVHQVDFLKHTVVLVPEGEHGH
jgi:predicted RNA-binding protein